MKIEQFLANATHIKQLYVSSDSKSWATNPLKGYSLKTREEILNGTTSVVAESNEEESNVIEKPKKIKKK